MHIITIDSEKNSILYQPAVEVATPLTQEIKQKIENMRMFYKSCGDKAGFAAPQVGLSEKIILIEKHLFDSSLPEADVEPVILINPSWKPLDDEKALDIEGCLSVPGKTGMVSRYINVELTALHYCAKTEEISPIKKTYHREFSCALWQHEIDHLDGEIYVDKAELVLNDSDFALLQQYLIYTGTFQPNMTIFDRGPIIYDLAREWKQKNPENLPAFLESKINLLKAQNE